MDYDAFIGNPRALSVQYATEAISLSLWSITSWGAS